MTRSQAARLGLAIDEQQEQLEEQFGDFVQPGSQPGWEGGAVTPGEQQEGDSGSVSARVGGSYSSGCKYSNPLFEHQAVPFRQPVFQGCSSRPVDPMEEIGFKLQGLFGGTGGVKWDGTPGVGAAKVLRAGYKRVVNAELKVKASARRGPNALLLDFEQGSVEEGSRGGAAWNDLHHALQSAISSAESGTAVSTAPLHCPALEVLAQPGARGGHQPPQQTDVLAQVLQALLAKTSATAAEQKQFELQLQSAGLGGSSGSGPSGSGGAGGAGGAAASTGHLISSKDAALADTPALQVLACAVNTLLEYFGKPTREELAAFVKEIEVKDGEGPLDFAARVQQQWERYGGGGGSNCMAMTADQLSHAYWEALGSSARFGALVRSLQLHYDARSPAEREILQLGAWVEAAATQRIEDAWHKQRVSALRQGLGLSDLAVGHNYGPIVEQQQQQQGGVGPRKSRVIGVEGSSKADIRAVLGGLSRHNPDQWAVVVEEVRKRDPLPPVVGKEVFGMGQPQHADYGVAAAGAALGGAAGGGGKAQWQMQQRQLHGQAQQQGASGNSQQRGEWRQPSPPAQQGRLEGQGRGYRPCECAHRTHGDQQPCWTSNPRVLPPGRAGPPAHTQDGRVHDHYRVVDGLPPRAQPVGVGQRRQGQGQGPPPARGQQQGAPRAAGQLAAVAVDFLGGPQGEWPADAEAPPSAFCVGVHGPTEASVAMASCISRLEPHPFQQPRQGQLVAAVTTRGQGGAVGGREDTGVGCAQAAAGVVRVRGQPQLVLQVPFRFGRDSNLLQRNLEEISRAAPVGAGVAAVGQLHSFLPGLGGQVAQPQQSEAMPAGGYVLAAVLWPLQEELLREWQQRDLEPARQRALAAAAAAGKPAQQQSPVLGLEAAETEFSFWERQQGTEEVEELPIWGTAQASAAGPKGQQEAVAGVSSGGAACGLHRGTGLHQPIKLADNLPPVEPVEVQRLVEEHKAQEGAMLFFRNGSRAQGLSLVLPDGREALPQRAMLDTGCELPLLEPAYARSIGAKRVLMDKPASITLAGGERREVLHGYKDIGMVLCAGTPWEFKVMLNFYEMEGAEGLFQVAVPSLFDHRASGVGADRLFKVYRFRPFLSNGDVETVAGVPLRTWVSEGRRGGAVVAAVGAAAGAGKKELDCSVPGGESLGLEAALGTPAGRMAAAGVAADEVEAGGEKAEEKAGGGGAVADDEGSGKRKKEEKAAGGCGGGCVEQEEVWGGWLGAAFAPMWAMASKLIFAVVWLVILPLIAPRLVLGYLHQRLAALCWRGCAFRSRNQRRAAARGRVAGATRGWSCRQGLMALLLLWAMMLVWGCGGVWAVDFRQHEWSLMVTAGLTVWRVARLEAGQCSFRGPK